MERRTPSTFHPTGAPSEEPGVGTVVESAGTGIGIPNLVWHRNRGTRDNTASRRSLYRATTSGGRFGIVGVYACVTTSRSASRASTLDAQSCVSRAIRSAVNEFSDAEWDTNNNAAPIPTARNVYGTNRHHRRR